MTANPFKHITIIGVGLIGGSLGLAIKKRFPTSHVVGVDRKEVLRRALKRGAIDRSETDLGRAVREADLVFLAAPLSVILRQLPTLARNCKRDAIVSDVGSVKLQVVRRAAKYFPRGNFIGGHPMAGIELSGIEAAHPLLFENAIYILSPTRSTSRPLVKRLGNFLGELGARVVLLDPRAHDEVASAVSHLPQLTAVALMNVVGQRHPTARNYLRLAAGGFRDITRVASSRSDIWKDILAINRGEIRRSLRLLIRELDLYSKLLQNHASSRLITEFSRARGLRSRIPKSMKGFLHPLAEVYVFVHDKPGALARLTAALARGKVNIKDIELMKIREGTGGTFRLSFDSAQICRRAESILKKAGFEIGG
jgi:prephenate dehydrogenase